MRKILQVIILVLPVQAWAQSEQAPDVESLVREAVAAYPGVAQLRLEAWEARALESAAAALPDPLAQLMLTDASFPRWTVGNQEMSMLGISVEQGLLYPGKRTARRSLAQAETLVRSARRAALRALVTLDVRRAYAMLYRLDTELSILSEAQNLLAALGATTRARYAAGLTSQESVVKVMLRQARLSERRSDLERERVETVATLNRFLNRPAGTPLGRVSGLPAPASPDPAWVTTVIEEAPEVRAATAEVEALRREVAVAESELKPNLFAGGAVGTRGKLGAVATLTFGVEWPWWKKEKQQPQVAAARLRLEAAQAQLATVQGGIREEAARLYAAWQNAREQAALYEERVLPLSEAALTAARAAFTAGENGLSTVIEDFNMWLDARVGLAERQAQAFSAWAGIRYLLGDEGGEL